MSVKTEREQHHKDLDKIQGVKKGEAPRNPSRSIVPHRQPDLHFEVPAAKASGDEEEKVVEVDAFGGAVYISSHGEAKLDREGLIVLRNALDQCFQAVT